MFGLTLTSTRWRENTTTGRPGDLVPSEENAGTIRRNHRPHREKPMRPWTIETATPTDQTYIEHLQRLHSNSLGFVPRIAITDHVTRGNYDLLTINGQPAGYVMHGGGIRRPYRLIQVALSEDLWRKGFGRRLLASSLARARTRPQPTMTATVAEELTMNEVARATGARIIRIEPAANRRKRRLIHWEWEDGQLLTSNGQTATDDTR